MSDKLTEARERYARKRLPRLFSGGGDDQRSQIREHYLGIGIVFGTGLGVAIGTGLGAAFGNVALGIVFGICIGTGLGIVIGSIVGNRRAGEVQESRDANDSYNA